MKRGDRAKLQAWFDQLPGYYGDAYGNPFRSEAQRRKFYAMQRSGEISPEVVEEWERSTGARKLPARVNSVQGMVDQMRERDSWSWVFKCEDGSLHLGEPPEGCRYTAHRWPPAKVAEHFGERTRRNPRRTQKTKSKGSKRIRNLYTDRHWGIKPTKVYRVQMPNLPRETAEMGKLLRLDVIDPEDDAELGIDFPRRADIILAFDEGTPERLYYIYPKFIQHWVAKTLWIPGEPSYWLGDVARAQGGRQCDRRYPRVKVQVLGENVFLLYRTRKGGDYKEDGQGSDYIHEHGEDSGLRPLLCVTENGRLWTAGGNYTVGTGGVED